MVAMLAAGAAPRSARAGIVEVRGVELTIPDGWTQSAKGGATMLASPKTKGRVIEVIDLPKMPEATPAALEHVLGNAGKLAISAAGQGDRAGTKVIAAQGTFVTPKASVQIHLAIFPVQTHAVMIMSFVGADQDPVIGKANDDILASARIAGPRLSVVYTAPTTKGVTGASPKFVKFVTLLAPKLDALFRFPRPLPIKIEECGTVNAFYSPADHSIRVCHELFDFLDRLFAGAGFDAQNTAETTQYTVIFAFFHEFGHALVGELGLPIVGKGEDAADEVATIFLAGNEFGQKVAMAAATWFSVMSAHKQHANFADEHSLDQQRVVSIVCLLYGADKKYSQLATKLEMTPDRLAKCNRDWIDRNKAWDKLLAPYFVAQNKPKKA
ncbi:MAG TPA: DUF4344 domain-containing metallopeptidase [Kofleriaceae bacterium]|nr:DUF4344 domain-containing metallopeptidase [Kofleriaceae bacterium]